MIVHTSTRRETIVWPHFFFKQHLTLVEGLGHRHAGVPEDADRAHRARQDARLQVRLPTEQRSTATAMHRTASIYLRLAPA